MYNYDKLRGKIVEKYRTDKNFSKALNVSNRTLSLKLNNKVPFSTKDIELICQLLGVDLKEVYDYFFTKNVQALNK